MTRQDYYFWLIGIGLSIVIHASLFFQSDAQFGTQSVSPSSEALVTRLTFAKPFKAIEEMVDSSEVRHTDAIKEKIQKPSVTPVKKNINPVLEKERSDELIEQKVTEVVPSAQGQLSEAGLDVLKENKELFMQQLLAHIESNKFYPRSARSRGIQGDVLVSFALLANGEIQSLHVSGGHRVLQSATKQAVNNAIPLPLPPSGFSTPYKVQFVLTYRLR